MNIFLASNDHVKIGDFGLATKIAIRTPQIETSGMFALFTKVDMIGQIYFYCEKMYYFFTYF